MFNCQQRLFNSNTMKLAGLRSLLPAKESNLRWRMGERGGTICSHSIPIASNYLNFNKINSESVIGSIYILLHDIDSAPLQFLNKSYMLYYFYSLNCL